MRATMELPLSRDRKETELITQDRPASRQYSDSGDLLFMGQGRTEAGKAASSKEAIGKCFHSH